MNNKSIIYNITNSKRIFKSKSHESIDNCSSIVEILIFQLNEYVITNEIILNNFIKTWELTENIFNSIIDDDIFYKKISLNSRPLMFYYIHIAAEYINIAKRANLIYSINDMFEKIYSELMDDESINNIFDKSILLQVNYLYNRIINLIGHLFMIQKNIGRKSKIILFLL